MSKKILINIFASILFFAVLFELFSFLFTKFELLSFNVKPSYSLSHPKGLGVAWRNEKLPWGAWHKVNQNDFHKLDCVDVNYFSNDYGARDNKQYKNLQNKETIILLGDSMLEGIGVDYYNTTPYLIETRYSTPTVNLSAAGDFGPLQYYLIYKNFKDEFNHKNLIIFFDPVNDFTDNYWEHWKNIDTKRYRPYYKINSEEDYEIFYPKNAKKRDQFAQDLSLSGLPLTFIKNFTYSSNVLRMYKYRHLFYQKGEATIHKNSGYYYKNKTAIDGSLHYLKKILEISPPDTNIRIVILPVKGDINSYLVGNEYKDLYWYKKLINLTKNVNVQIVDLMDYIDKDNYNDNFLECDGHLSKNGHQWVLKSLYDSQKSGFIN